MLRRACPCRGTCGRPSDRLRIPSAPSSSQEILRTSQLRSARLISRLVFDELTLSTGVKARQMTAYHSDSARSSSNPSWCTGPSP